MSSDKIIDLEERRKIKNSKIENNDIFIVEAENNLLYAILSYINDRDVTDSFNLKGIYEIIKDMELDELDELMLGENNKRYERFKKNSRYMQEDILLNLKAKLMIEVTEPDF